MKRSINSLLGYTIKGTDGEIGKVEEFYFDDHTSTIRYMVVKTGGWFSEKKVLISPEAFQNAEREPETFSINLTQEKIKNSPDIDTDKPVSLQQEELMRGYYSLPGYYGYEMYGYGEFGMWGYPIVRDIKEEKELQKIKAKEHKNDNPHLRSTHEVTGYDIHATDGNIGKVNDFIIDDTTWKIHFLVVETGNWFSEKKVLFSPNWIKEIDWKTGSVIINTTIADVKASPEYDPKQELTDEYSLVLHDYYDSLLLIDKEKTNNLKTIKIQKKIMENSISHTYHIGGMTCGGCANTVKNKLTATAGVTSVKVDLEKKEAEITSSKEIKIEMYEKALSNTGYSIEALHSTQKGAEKKQRPGHWADGSVVHSAEIHTNPHHSGDIDGAGIGSINTGPVTSYGEE